MYAIYNILASCSARHQYAWTTKFPKTMSFNWQQITKDNMIYTCMYIEMSYYQKYKEMGLKINYKICAYYGANINMQDKDICYIIHRYMTSSEHLLLTK